MLLRNIHPTAKILLCLFLLGVLLYLTEILVANGTTRGAFIMPLVLFLYFWAMLFALAFLLTRKSQIENWSKNHHREQELKTQIKKTN